MESRGCGLRLGVRYIERSRRGRDVCDRPTLAPMRERCQKGGEGMARLAPLLATALSVHLQLS